MATTIGEAVSEDAEAARRLGSLTRRSDAAGIAQLAGHVGALVVTGYLVSISIGTVWLPLALLVHGLDMRVNSRTTLTNRAMRRLAWNMPFHTAHHVYPGVPFHALPDVHERIRDSVRYEARGYFAVQRELVSKFSRT